MANRAQRRAIAEQTVEILDQGSYLAPDGTRHEIAASLAAAMEGTRLYRAEDLLVEESPAGGGPPNCDVINQTTFAGGLDLLADGAPNVCCLNFASAMNPGGGWIDGSQAQEEALARASGLARCLKTQWDYYAENRANASLLFLDHIIFSPDVPVFRDDDGQLLNTPWLCSFVTAPAPRADKIRTLESESIDKILPTLRARAWRILEICRLEGHRNIVLGAWGCGVFGNDPSEVAGAFRDLLSSERFATAFDRVRFSVLDPRHDGTYGAFERVFA